MKEKITNAFKVWLVFTTGMFGFLSIYALVGLLVGLPAEDWFFISCGALAILSEFGLFRWLAEE